ncbi:TerC family protein [Aeribacillus sp. FSL M8-0235]|uniref:TerC family protein n=1 Tax=Aeribacillus sp. FSL M8-0235 TaxID=2954576 RepID=UPI0030F4B93D
MDEQFFTSLFLIIGIDLILGGDNAIVIALACRNLPENQRRKGILFGTMLAILSRILLTVLAVHLLNIPFLQFFGGLFLMYIAFLLLTGNEGEHTSVKSHRSLWKAIQTIVLADLFMGFDNVIAVAGAAGGNIFLVITGLLISIPIIIWGSRFIMSAMSRFPLLIYGGGGILAYTAGKMMATDEKMTPLLKTEAVAQTLPYFTACLILFFALFYNITKK